MTASDIDSTAGEAFGAYAQQEVLIPLSA